MMSKELQRLSEGTVDQIKEVLPSLSKAELERLHRIEEQGENRSTLLNAIHSALGQDVHEERVDTSLANDFPREVELGRSARRSSIAVEDAPFDPSSKQYAAWRLGYDGKVN